MNADAWQGPPSDILGHHAPIERFVARTRHAVVALQQVVAYPQGCLLTLHIAARRGSLPASAWERLNPGWPAGETDLRFGIRFPDGTRATTVDNAFPGWSRPTDRPEPPMLVDAGGGSSGSDRRYRSDRSFWLWPLPPPVPFELVIAWQTMGIAPTATTIDGSAIAHAAAHAQPYWP